MKPGSMLFRGWNWEAYLHVLVYLGVWNYNFIHVRCIFMLHKLCKEPSEVEIVLPNGSGNIMLVYCKVFNRSELQVDKLTYYQK